jgi:hypothetical protein
MTPEIPVTSAEILFMINRGFPKGKDIRAKNPHPFIHSTPK